MRRDVLWLIGVLVVAAIILGPLVRRRIAQRDLEGCVQNLKELGMRLEMYDMENLSFPYRPPYGGRGPEHAALAALVPKFLKEIPTCPAAGRDTYSESFEAIVNPNAYTLECCGAYHSELKVKPDYPKYTSTQGLMRE